MIDVKTPPTLQFLRFSHDFLSLVLSYDLVLRTDPLSLIPNIYCITEMYYTVVAFVLNIYPLLLYPTTQSKVRTDPTAWSCPNGKWLKNLNGLRIAMIETKEKLVPFTIFYIVLDEYSLCYGRLYRKPRFKVVAYFPGPLPFCQIIGPTLD